MRLMLFIWLLGAAGFASPAWAQGPTPKADWLVLNDPAAAGWNPAALAAGRSLADSLGTAAYMLIEDGRVVDSYGDITRAFRTHSMRKSLLSALYGVHLPELEPYLDRPLAELPDLARFGLLYLRGGEWDGREIVPRAWVEQTTAWSSDVARPDGTLLPGTGYGTMWWVLRPPAVPESFGGEIFAAGGTGTQAILILPALNIGFVHRTDTDLPSDQFRAVSAQEIYNLLDRMLVGYPEQRTSSP